ncbi:MAG: undecaprenyldiphospho-muramoylpentapeptide beta-N-acetylglucosaminyltransferase [Deltaproteobacteria bacterium]|nr:undecaprenyldiphospho-muramoylpentapeptide beta-N-acetylglucosaminyltransferase [Deltaproteobacteria bacterium]
MRWMIAGGGTGGHVYPGIVVAQALKKLAPEVEPIFVGTAQGLESRIIPEQGFRLLTLEAGKWVGRRWSDRVKTLVQLPKAYQQVKKWIRELDIQFVLGVGGYASVSPLLAAYRLRIPSGLLEVNSRPGAANKFLARFVDRVFLGLEGGRPYFPDAKVRMSGIPVRQEFFQIPSCTTDSKPFSILVFGGSQGARALNRVVIDSLSELKDLKEDLFWIHQTGLRDLHWVQEAYARHGFQSEVAAFFDPIVKYYERAHLVISRSGASTLGELLASGRPSLLIPYPHSAGGHQRFNALALQRYGASEVISSDQLTGRLLAHKISRYFQSRSKLQYMAAQARELARPQAAERIVEEGFKLIAERKRKGAPKKEVA